MTYITQEQLIEAFTEDELIQLTDRDRLGVIDAGVLGEAISKAELRVNGYISPPYRLPLEQAFIDGSSLSEMAGYIVRRILYKDLATEQVSQDYKDAISWLRDVQSGRVSLGQQEELPVNTGRIVQKQGHSMHDWGAY